MKASQRHNAPLLQAGMLRTRPRTSSGRDLRPRQAIPSRRAKGSGPTQVGGCEHASRIFDLVIAALESFTGELTTRRQRIVAGAEDLSEVLSEPVSFHRAVSDNVVPRTRAIDRNLVTVKEFAQCVGCAESSVWELIKIGLPSRRIAKIGRRVLRAEAEAWLIGGGGSRGRSTK